LVLGRTVLLSCLEGRQSAAHAFAALARRVTNQRRGG
jgi:hypothetical protein